MKILRKSMISKKNQKLHAINERIILEKIDCKFIVKLFYAFQTEQRLFFILEFIQGGKLFI